MASSREKYGKIVSEFTELIGDKLPLIGDCASLPHPKKVLLYAVSWMIADYEAEREAATDQVIRNKYEALLPALGLLFTRLARDWHEIDAEDRDAVVRLRVRPKSPLPDGRGSDNSGVGMGFRTHS